MAPSRFALSSFAPLWTWLLIAMLLSIKSIGFDAAVLIGLWYFLLDGPHVVASILRLSAWRQTEFRTRALLLSSIATFLGLGALWIFYDPHSPGISKSFLSLFLLLSYWHIANQHKGFFFLLHRFENKPTVRLPQNLIHLFLLTLWAPLALRLIYFDPFGGLPLPNLRIIAQSQVTTYLGFAFLFGLYLCAVAVGIYYKKRSQILSSHLVYMANIMPINCIGLFAPVPALFGVMILTFSHNLQYLDFTYGMSYPRETASWFSKGFRFFALSVLVTLCFFRGDFFDWWTTYTGLALENLINGSQNGSFGLQALAAMGFLASIFHYSLDSFMWKFRNDSSLADYVTRRAGSSFKFIWQRPR